RWRTQPAARRDLAQTELRHPKCPRRPLRGNAADRHRNLPPAKPKRPAVRHPSPSNSDHTHTPPPINRPRRVNGYAQLRRDHPPIQILRQLKEFVMRFISTQMHAAMDYLGGILLIVVPLFWMNSPDVPQAAIWTPVVIGGLM